MKFTRNVSFIPLSSTWYFVPSPPETKIVLALLTAVNSPNSFSTTRIQFNITVNKKADCWFSDNETDPRDQTWGSNPVVEAFTPTPSKQITLSSGSHTYYFNCRAYSDTSDEDSKEFAFKIDTIEPQIKGL